MKHLKKLLAFAIVAVMMLSLCSVSAWADDSYTITIDNALEGETYSAYKVFDVTYANANEDYEAPAEAEDVPGAPDQGHQYTAYSYTISTSSAFWDDLIEIAASSASNEYLLSDFGLKFVGTSTAGVYSVLPSDATAGVSADQAAALAAYLATKLDGKTPVASGTAEFNEEDGYNEHDSYNTGVLTLDVSAGGPGYYFVDTTTGSLCSLDTTEPNATIREKNTVSIVDKTVEEDSTGDFGDKDDADIGQVINFMSLVTIGKHQKNVVYHDVMSAGLTLNADSIVVSDNAAGHYTVYTEDNFPEPAEGAADPFDGDTFAVVFDSSWTEGLEADTDVIITYSAILNKNAIVGNQSELDPGAGNDNTPVITFGNNQRITGDWVRVYTWSFQILKEDGNKTPLAGAKFKLMKGETTLSFVKIDDGSAAIAGSGDDEGEPARPVVYRLAIEGDQNPVTEFVTPDWGLVELQGLDADTYSLVETEAPTGFNPLKDPIEVVVDSNTDTEQGTDGTKQKVITLTVNGEESGLIDVINQSGTELPSTGGIGTTIFYTVGGILLVGAAVMLVTKKRISQKF